MKKRFLIQWLMSILIVGFAGSLYALPSQVYLKTIGVSPGSAGSFYFSGLGTRNVLYGEYDLAIDWDKAGPEPYVPISGFCVENAWATSSDNQTYELLLPYDSYVNAAYILSQYQAGQISAQAGQIATWEAILDPGNTDVQIGSNFHANFTNSYTDEAESFLATMYTIDLSGFPVNNFRIARNPVGSDPPNDYQDYIISVPDASIMFLLGPAFIMLGLLGRKKSKEYL